MASATDYPETPKLPGERERLLERQQMRLAGLLNQPVKWPRGLANVILAMQGRRPHSLFCKCIECIPSELRPEFAPVLDEAPLLEVKSQKRRRKRKEPPSEPQKMTPAGQEAKSGYPQPKKKWSEQRGRSSN